MQVSGEAYLKQKPRVHFPNCSGIFGYKVSLLMEYVGSIQVKDDLGSRHVFGSEEEGN